MNQVGQSQFDKSLMSKDVIALACGAMIGWSWVLLTGEWIMRAGVLGAAIAFVMGSVIVLLIGLTYAELASAMPKVGGEHQYTLRALGYLPSFIASWAVVTAYVTVCVFEELLIYKWSMQTVMNNLYESMTENPNSSVCGPKSNG